ncbi:MAG: biotin/lipoyl-containing protein, partial [Natronomonas sp.]|nr:biotin/lipoyl-containing protein [Natronomonas sp.]
DAERLAAAVERWGAAETSANAQPPSARTLAVEVDGRRFDVLVEDGVVAASGDGSGGDESGVVEAGAITAEMQGTILSLERSEGDTVSAGDVVCVLEAMKMENDVVAETGGTIAEVPVSEGDSVNMGDTLVVLE